MSSKFMTVQEAADELKVSTWSVYRLLWDAQVQSIKVGRCRRIVRQSFDAYVSGLIESAA